LVAFKKLFYAVEADEKKLSGFFERHPELKKEFSNNI